MRIHNTHFKCVAWSFFLLSSLPSFCAFAYHHYAFEKLQSCDWTVLTQNLEKRKKWLSSLPWGTVLNNHWSRFEQSFCTIKKSWNQCFLKKKFWELLPPTGGCCFTASVLWNGSSPPGGTPFSDWVMRSSEVWCTVCGFIVKQMSLYLVWRALACGVFVLCVRRCMYVCMCCECKCSRIISCFCFTS